MMAPYTYMLAHFIKMMKCFCQKRARFRVRFGICIVNRETGEHECAPGTHLHWSIDGARAELLEQPAPPSTLRLVIVEVSYVEVEAAPVFT